MGGNPSGDVADVLGKEYVDTDCEITPDVDEGAQDVHRPRIPMDDRPDDIVGPEPLGDRLFRAGSVEVQDLPGFLRVGEEIFEDPLLGGVEGAIGDESEVEPHLPDDGGGVEVGVKLVRAIGVPGCLPGVHAERTDDEGGRRRQVAGRPVRLGIHGGGDGEDAVGLDLLERLFAAVTIHVKVRVGVDEARSFRSLCTLLGR